MSFVFFGTSQFSIFVLESLKSHGLHPVLIVTAPDKPKGRGLEMTPSQVKVWALQNAIPTLTPTKLSDTAFVEELKKYSVDVYIVASYGKIIPDSILTVPKCGTLNVHPSLLPHFRGASPVQSTILADQKNTGVTIIKLDSEMDHGPILAQEKVTVENWPLSTLELKEKLAHVGADILATKLPLYIAGKAHLTEQDHSKVTFTKKIEKKEGEITLSGNAYANFLKFKAYSMWPGVYFFTQSKNGTQMRVLIKDASFADDVFTPLRVVPEGKKEMNYSDFLRGNK